ncbi:MAG: multicopper oxidase family protein [Gaiellaceae bacterium]
MRRALVSLLAVAALALVGVAAGLGVLYASADTSTVGELEFANELRIPPLLEGQADGDGAKVFDLRLQTGTTELLPGTTTETWGVNGPYLGPTLRVSSGDRVQMNVRNELPEPTTVHWHGMHLPAGADGGPHQPIAPGGSWAPAWTVDQPAATLWYHPHPHPDSDEQIYRGVAGMIVVDDADADRLQIPSTYGVDDVPVILQDKNFHDDGRLDVSKRLISPTGILGEDILLNGTYAPYFEVAAELTRLRLLNASTARVYELGLGDGRSFDLIATDGGLLEVPIRLERLPLSPGERAEIVVGLEPGERVVLRSFEPDLGTNVWDGRFAGADDSFDLLELRASASLRPSAPLPAQLGPPRRVGTPVPRADRSFELGGQGSIDDREFDPNRIDVEASAGSTELWEVRNASGTPHNFHVHGVRFQVVDYAGGSPPPRLVGWKDTVYVPPDETVRFLVELGDYADPEVPYMFHCHVLQHQDRGMMGQFVVTEEATR